MKRTFVGRARIIDKKSYYANGDLNVGNKTYFFITNFYPRRCKRRVGCISLRNLCTYRSFLPLSTANENVILFFPFLCTATYTR